MLGTIQKSYGAPEYLAVDVLLEDGQPELFWFHQLETANKKSLLAHSVAFYDDS